MTNEFFAELARCLRKQEIDSKINQDKRLEVFLHGQPVLFVSPKNEVFLLPEMSGNDEAGDLYHEVAQTADEVWDYVEAVQTSDLLSVSGLSEEFHLLADFGGALLAGREREQGSGYAGIEYTYVFDKAGKWLYFPVGEAYEWRDLKEDLENDTIHFAVPDEELMKELGLTGEAWDDDLEEEEITQEMFGGI